jgi:glycosyltransferase involved in cell wall biosynthesis
LTLGISDDALLFGYAGHLRPEKNLGLLLSAFIKADIPKAKLLILGSGPCEAELRQLAEELKAGERVVFHEATPDPAPFYAAMDVFVLSSSTEQMPISLLEAMACGLPAVCTDVGDVKTMLDAPEGALPPKGDNAAYVQALKHIAADRQAREAAGIGNRARCELFYGVETMIDAYRSLYQEAVCRWS